MLQLKYECETCNNAEKLQYQNNVVKKLLNKIIKQQYLKTGSINIIEWQRSQQSEHSWMKNVPLTVPKLFYV